jgi:hypothetical protein
MNKLRTYPKIFDEELQDDYGGLLITEDKHCCGLVHLGRFTFKGNLAFLMAHADDEEYCCIVNFSNCFTVGDLTSTLSQELQSMEQALVSTVFIKEADMDTEENDDFDNIHVNWRQLYNALREIPGTVEGPQVINDNSGNLLLPLFFLRDEVIHAASLYNKYNTRGKKKK